MLKIHHLNCGSMCPFGGHYIDGFSHSTQAHLVCHCLCIETEQGLVLVDTGIGKNDINFKGQRINPIIKKLFNIQFREEDTALAQIERLGFTAEDVTHIVLTHLDFDHAGGLADFPYAKVHVLRSELEASLHPNNWMDRNRYRKDEINSKFNWETYESQGEKWLGFECVRNLQGLPPEILLVPLQGHSRGHCGIAIDTRDGWLLHAGDAYFYRGEMDLNDYHCTLGLRLFQDFMDEDYSLRIWNQKRLRKLNIEQGGNVKIFCSHDAIEFENLLRESSHDFDLFHLKEVNYPEYQLHH